MILVIQCAAGKRFDAGPLRAQDGRPVLFVANPVSAPVRSDVLYARPDDLAGDGLSWREKLLDYNARPGGNPLKLLPAWELYRNPAYRALAEKFGIAKLYILSAGWGLIAADFLTPAYDITFTAAAESHKRRLKGDRYADLCMLPADTAEPIVFLGAKDYLPLFCRLTSGVRAERTVFYNAQSAPTAPGCTLKRFDTSARTNWHYGCAKAFIDGSI